MAGGTCCAGSAGDLFQVLDVLPADLGCMCSPPPRAHFRSASQLCASTFRGSVRKLRRQYNTGALQQAPSANAHSKASILHRFLFRIWLTNRTEGDYVLLEEKRQTGTKELLVKLKPSGALNTHRGIIQHDEIIGKQTRQLVRTSRGLYRIHEPTLADYVRLTPRLVTPVRLKTRYTTATRLMMIRYTRQTQT